MLDAGPWMDQPAEVAAAMLAADAVVAGAGSLGHLAGALGCPRLAVLAPAIGDWCWGMPGGGSPWYSSARVMRAGLTPAGADWRPALAALAAEAAGWVATGAEDADRGSEDQPPAI